MSENKVFNFLKGIPIIELHEIDEENDTIEKENIMKRYQYIEIKRLSDRIQKDKIEVDDKELTEEEKKNMFMYEY